MSEIDVDYYVWNRYQPYQLHVEEELLGTVHEYHRSDKVIRVKFPDISEYKYMDSEAKLTASHQRHYPNGEVKPEFYTVLCLYIYIDDGSTVRLDEDFFSRDKICDSDLPEERQRLFRSKAQKEKLYADKFYRELSNVIRWVKYDHRILRNPQYKVDGGWRSRIMEKGTDRTIWSGGGHLVICGGEPVVTTEDWSKVSQYLKEQCNPPIYLELINDAEHHISLGEYSRAIYDLAISAETYIRKLVSQSLPENLGLSYVQILDEYNIRPILTKVLPSLMNEVDHPRLKKITKVLHALFDDRNKLFHCGETESISSERCEKYLVVLKNLVDLSPRKP